MPNTKTPIKKAELLIPAGSLEKLKTAVHYGADAVYFGTPDLSLRVRSAFSLEDVIEGVEFAHANNTKVYLTLNMFSHNQDLARLPQFVETISKVNPDGVIIADPGVFHFVKKHAPTLPLHISTQANVCSSLSVQFWKDQGADLCVLGREVSFEELKQIRADCPDTKLEVFVHGAMCMAYSGRCLLSNFMAERGANQGNCAHNCRWSYTVRLRMNDGTVRPLEINEDNHELFEFLLEEGCRPGEFMPIEEDTRGSYIMNAKDLCLLPKLPEILSLGIDSLKIEGRNKSQYYVGVVTRAYRQAIDDWYENPESWDPKPYLEELHSFPNRGYTQAFHDGRLTNLSHNYENTSSVSTHEFAGMVTEIHDDHFVLLVKNKMEPGDVLELLPPHHRETIRLRLYEFTEATTLKKLDAVHGGQERYIRLDYSLFDLINANWVKDVLTVGTLARKDRALNAVQDARLKLDILSEKREAGKFSDNAYTEAKNKLQILQDATEQDTPKKTPRLGLEGCCGKGCNGCLMFKHDPAFEKAREKLAALPMGKLLKKRALLEHSPHQPPLQQA